METAARVAVAIALLVAAGAKLRLRGDLPGLLAPYGVPRALRTPAAAALVLAEALVGVLLLANVAADPAAYAALGLGAVFLAAAAVARLRGNRRLRCGCFGASERPWAWVAARALGFAVLAGLAVFGNELQIGSPSRETLVLLALALLAVLVVALTVLVLALYRQVGILSLRIAPHGPLELAEEGPPIGTPAPALAGLERRGGELVAFFTHDCRLCRDLAPSIRALAGDGLRVHVAYEHEQPGAFERWNVPGTPFVVHVVDGVVTAKGLVNTLEQLDRLVETGRARRRGAAA
jgi:hypothetical protein